MGGSGSATSGASGGTRESDMNLDQAMSLQMLRTPNRATETRGQMTAVQMARHIFRISAQAGTPYRNITPEQWAQTWLDSERFVLMEVEADKVALPRVPMNEKTLTRDLYAAQDSLEPIVVDTNKQQIGRSPAGFVPRVIAVDGQHRYRAQRLQGRETLMAWVGEKAVELFRSSIRNPYPNGKTLTRKHEERENFQIETGHQKRVIGLEEKKWGHKVGVRERPVQRVRADREARRRDLRHRLGRRD